MRPLNPFWLLLVGLLSLPTQSFGLADNNAEGDCSFIINGTVTGGVDVNCPAIPKRVIDKLLASLDNQQLTIDLLKEKIAKLEADQKKALAENAEALKEQPENPLLVAEKAALIDFDFELAAQLREKHIRKLRKERSIKRALEDQAFARELFIGGGRWESAYNLEKALALYQEAVEVDPAYPKAWRQITLVAKKLGNTQIALEAARSLQKHIDHEKDLHWLSIALDDEADLLVRLGLNKLALEKYLASMALSKEFLVAEPENTEWQRDLSVSHNKVGDMHKANGDGVSALKAYEGSLVIWNKLKKIDPNNVDWQRGSTIPLERIGDMYKANGDGVSALKAYEDGLAIAKKLAELNPDVVQWQTDLVVSYYKLSEMQPEKSQELLGKALVILTRLNDENRLEHEKQEWIPFLENALK